MKGYDPEGNLGPKKPLPDSVRIDDPPPDKVVTEITSEQREPVSVPMPIAPEEAYQQPVDAYQQEAYTEQY